MPRGKGNFAPDGINIANVAQAVERILGKDEVGGSNPLVGSTLIGFLSQTHRRNTKWRKRHL